MPLYDFYCEDCEIKEEILIIKNEEVKCKKCGKLMKREFPNKTNFKLVYNNKTDVCDWQGNTSQYHRKDVFDENGNLKN